MTLEIWLEKIGSCFGFCLKNVCALCLCVVDKCRNLQGASQLQQFFISIQTKKSSNSAIVMSLLRNSNQNRLKKS